MSGSSIAWIVAGSAAAIGIGIWFSPRIGDDVLTVESKPIVSAPRVGVNLGLWTAWGDSQFPSNILKNPGFEPPLDRALLVAAAVNGAVLTDDTDWLQRAAHFWAGGRYSVRSGAAAGRDGSIVDSRGLDVELDAALPVASGDVVALSVDGRPPVLPQWWIETKAPASVAPEPAEKRPGSPGTQSVRLTAHAGSSADLVSYLDAISGRAGKLLPVEGEWRLSFWARCTLPPCSVQITFRRESTAAFLRQTVPIAPGWKNYDLDFRAHDVGSAGMLSLRFHSETTALESSLLLDDVNLEKQADAAQPFRSELVATLNAIHPGYLRDWQGQLGDSFHNRVAEGPARRPTRYRPVTEDADTHYSLPDFLWLSQKVGAVPWIVIPTTWSDSECSEFGEWLAPRLRSQFPEVRIEFGNENWNTLFRPAGVLDPVVHAAVATRCFERIGGRLGGYQGAHFVMNAPAYQAEILKQLDTAAPSDVGLSIAPYSFYSLNGGRSPTSRLEALQEDLRGKPNVVAKNNRLTPREYSVYEVNLHTVDGTAPPQERNPLVGGAPAAAGLLWRLMDSFEAGIRAQCVYTLSQFDTQLSTVSGYTPLWGITRSLAYSPRLRPSGHALAMLNSLLPGEIHRIQMPRNATVRGYAIHGEGTWQYLFLSLNGDERSWALRLPKDAPAPQSARILAARGFQDTNEELDLIHPSDLPFDTAGGEIAFRLPPWSVAVFSSHGPEKPEKH